MRWLAAGGATPRCVQQEPLQMRRTRHLPRAQHFTWLAPEPDSRWRRSPPKTILCLLLLLLLLSALVASSASAEAELAKQPLAKSGQSERGDSPQMQSEQIRRNEQPTNNLTELEREGEDPYVRASMKVNSVIFLVGFSANALVILVILKFTRNASVNDIYILNLAFADIAFVSGLVFLVYTMKVGHWVFGKVMCKLYMTSTSLNQFASSLLLVIMSFDRFVAVCHPVYAQSFRQLGRAKKICVCIWFVCLVLMTPILIFSTTSVTQTCAISWPDFHIINYELFFTLYSFVLGFLLPLSLIAVSYLCVIRKLRSAASHSMSLGSERRSRSRESTNRRIENLVIVIICTYIICWLPYWITQLIVSFTPPDSLPEEFYIAFLIATSLTYTNSALNPLLYAFLSDNFNRRCSKVFRFMLPKFLQSTRTSVAVETHIAELEPATTLRPDSRGPANTSLINEPPSSFGGPPHRNRMGSRANISFGEPAAHHHQNRSNSMAAAPRRSLRDKWPPRGGDEWYNFIVYGDF